MSDEAEKKPKPAAPASESSPAAKKSLPPLESVDQAKAAPKADPKPAPKAAEVPVKKPAEKPAAKAAARPGDKTAKAPAAKPAPKPENRAAKPAAKPAPKLPQSKPARGFFPRARHFVTLLSFLIMVIAPVAAAQWYFSNRAADQYASTVGFVVRTPDIPTSSELLGGLSSIVGASSNDADILYEFIFSQELVRRVDEKLDLRSLYNKAENDPIFTLGDAPSIEQLMRYWPRMVQVSYDANTGLLELLVLAFDAQDAQDIAQAIFEESTAKINELSIEARADATRYADETLAQAAARLKTARLELTNFRNTNQIVDPSVTLGERSGLLNSLQQQLASATIDYNLLRSFSRQDDPRLTQAERRIEEINRLIDEEKRKIGIGDTGDIGDAFSTLYGQYEGLIVEREFAEQSYIAALQSYDAAVTNANRQARYLSAYILPTLSETSEYPQRWLLSGLLFLFCFFTWAIVFLVAYSLRDRR